MIYLVITAAIISAALVMSTVLILRARKAQRVLDAAERQKEKAAERDFMLQILAASKAGSATEAVQAVAYAQTFEQEKQKLAEALNEPKSLKELEDSLPQEVQVGEARYELVTLDSLRV